MRIFTVSVLPAPDSPIDSRAKAVNEIFIFVV